jgi:GDPmannose 4,6-dehydratase
MRTALITGITGQDGSYLAELLLSKDYRVIGLYRRSSVSRFERINHILSHPNLVMEEFDLTDPSGCHQLMIDYKPDEIYNLAAQSHVATSFHQPTTTFDINAIGVLNLLESIRRHAPMAKFYQASTSEMFGRNYTLGEFGQKYQNENTQFLPQSPYGVAKTAAHQLVTVYRLSYHIYACCGMLFNHESPRRGENFVTRKITKYIGQLINKETTAKLKLGNLDASRDWGHAKDYVEAMWLMLQQQNPEDFVIATGTTWSIRDFLKLAFDSVNLNYEDHIEIDPGLFRPAEVEFLRGNASKAQNLLGWEPKISFAELVKEMVEKDIERF